MMFQQPGENYQEKIQDYRAGKEARVKEKVLQLEKVLLPETLRIVEQARDKSASSWLNAIPRKEQSFDLNREEFRDSLRLLNNLPLKGLPNQCVCADQFSVNHALTCKKGGFILARHDEVRNVLTSQLNKVCDNVQFEPHLIPLDNEHFPLRSATTGYEARLDIKAGGFWRRGQNAFFGIRITHINSTSNRNLPAKEIFRRNEAEKSVITWKELLK